MPVIKILPHTEYCPTGTDITVQKNAVTTLLPKGTLKAL